MTKQERERDVHDRGDDLRARRAEMEADLVELVDLIDAERARWEERRASARELRQKVQDARSDTADDARMAWYLAEYQDAQQTIVAIQALVERHNHVAQGLTSCQQELMQLSRSRRRG